MILPEFLSIVLGAHQGLCKGDATPHKWLIGKHNIGCSILTECGPTQEPWESGHTPKQWEHAIFQLLKVVSFAECMQLYKGL